MLSNFSKIAIFISLSFLAILITVREHSSYLGELFNKKETFVRLPLTEVILKKEELLPVLKETILENSSVTSRAINEQTKAEEPKDITITKVAEVKKGVYETLEVTRSDIEDELYRPNISPCITPMSYKLGTFDQRFNLPKETFLKITRDAIAIWEEEAGTSLFTNNQADGALTINLIYDERQATTVNLGYLALEIDNTKQVAESTRLMYEKEKANYISDSELFNTEGADFQKRYAEYNEKVKNYNERGGATKEEYDVMMLELDILKKEATQFETRRSNLGERMEQINTRVKRYNELVEYVNGLIRKSNSIGSRTFTEGRFAPSINTIDIYQYSDETKLKRVLIHELGHALGIGHVENAQSVMYSFNSGTTTSLSKEDQRALKESCASR